MHPRRTIYLLAALFLASSSGWAACETGLPVEGGCEPQATQPKGNKGNITAGEWWGGLKSSVKQMGNDISRTAKQAEQSLKGGNKEKGGANTPKKEKAK